MYKVSVIVPVYNCEEYIQECITSLINQTWKNIEIIVVDDGSKDKTKDLVKSICAIDSRVKLFSQNNSGPSIARNYGITKATGKYITFCDADDSLSEDYIKKLVELAITKDYDIVTCGYIDTSKYGEVKLNDFYNGKDELDKNEFINCIFKGVGGTVWGKLFKMEIINNNNIKFNPQIYMCEDMIFLLNYVMKCSRYGAIEDNLYKYNRLNECSISKNLNLNYYDNLILVIQEIEKILVNNKFDLEYIDAILSKRIKDAITTLLIVQHSSINNYSRKEKIDNIKKILDNEYYIKYRDKFKTHILSDRIILFFINKKIFRLLNVYTFYLYNKQKVKDKIRGIL